MGTLRRLLPITAALALIAATGLVHGRLTNRWAPSDRLAAALKALDRVPTRLGPWSSEPHTIDRQSLQQGEIDGYVARRYHDPRSGDQVLVLLLCGRPGPIAVHTPEVCYPGAGYQPDGVPTRQVLRPDGAGPPAEFVVSSFRRPGPAGDQPLRVLWSMSPDGRWHVPAREPRLAFARFPALYKLYVIVEPAATGQPGTANAAAVRFLQSGFLDALQKALFDDPAGPRSAETRA